MLPALATAFNRARSLSRLHDHAAYDAAGLYSAQAPFAGTIADGTSGRLLPNEPEAWQAALFDPPSVATGRAISPRAASGFPRHVAGGAGCAPSGSANSA